VRQRVTRVGVVAGVQHLTGVSTGGNKRVVAQDVGDHGVDQGHQLAARPVRAGPVAQVDERIGGLLDAQPLGQRGR
jgi:hypothetical protein